jgi:hypothetical protein
MPNEAFPESAGEFNIDTAFDVDRVIDDFKRCSYAWELLRYMSNEGLGDAEADIVTISGREPADLLPELFDLALQGVVRRCIDGHGMVYWDIEVSNSVVLAYLKERNKSLVTDESYDNGCSRCLSKDVWHDDALMGCRCCGHSVYSSESFMSEEL